MIESWMNCALKRFWKEAVATYSKSYRGICVEGLKETTSINQHSLHPNPDSKREPSDYESGVVPVRQLGWCKIDEYVLHMRTSHITEAMRAHLVQASHSLLSDWSARHAITRLRRVPCAPPGFSPSSRLRFPTMEDEEQEPLCPNLCFSSSSLFLF
jgi:hypothetical protein